MTFKEKKDYLQYWTNSIDKSYREKDGSLAYHNISFLQGIVFGLSTTCKDDKQKNELYEIYKKFCNKENDKNDRF